MESKTGICKEKYNVAPPCTALRTIYFMAEDNSMFFGRPIFFSDDGHRSYNPPARGGKLNDVPLSLLRIYKRLDLTCLAIRFQSVCMQLITNEVSSRIKALISTEASKSVEGNKAVLHEWSKYWCFTKPVDV